MPNQIHVRVCFLFTFIELHDSDDTLLVRGVSGCKLTRIMPCLSESSVWSNFFYFHTKIQRSKGFPFPFSFSCSELQNYCLYSTCKYHSLLISLSGSIGLFFGYLVQCPYSTWQEIMTHTFPKVRTGGYPIIFSRWLTDSLILFVLVSNPMCCLETQVESTESSQTVTNVDHTTTNGEEQDREGGAEQGGESMKLLQYAAIMSAAFGFGRDRVLIDCSYLPAHRSPTSWTQDHPDHGMLQALAENIDTDIHRSRPKRQFTMSDNRLSSCQARSSTLVFT